jgi:hypothetical protein
LTTEENRYFCGVMEDKPLLYNMNISPTWFGSTFQFNWGAVNVIASAQEINDYRGSPGLDGSDQYSVIVAYTSSYKDKLIFKAINRSGGVSRYSYVYVNSYYQRVEHYTEPPLQDELWHDVLIGNCKLPFIPNILLTRRIRWQDLEKRK